MVRNGNVTDFRNFFADTLSGKFTMKKIRNEDHTTLRMRCCAAEKNCAVGLLLRLRVQLSGG